MQGVKHFLVHSYDFLCYFENILENPGQVKSSHVFLPH